LVRLPLSGLRLVDEACLSRYPSALLHRKTAESPASQTASQHQPTCSRHTPTAALKPPTHAAKMTDVMTPVRAVDPANIDRSVSPAEDFYHYASGTWLANNPIPEEYSRWGCFEELHEQAQAHIKAIMDACVSESMDTVHKTLVGVFYKTGMDEAAREAAELEPMRDVFEAIDASGSAAECMVLSARLKHEFGVPSAGFWDVFDSTDAKNSGWTVAHVGQSGLGIGDRDYYCMDDGNKLEVREKYVAHLERMLVLSGAEEGAPEKAQAVLALETEMAKASLTRVEKRDPHAVYNKFAGPSALAEKTGSGGLPWVQYFEAMGLESEDFGGLILDNPKLAVRMVELLEDEGIALDTWKCYLRYHALKSMAPHLNKAVVDEHFAFHTGVMTGQPKQKPLWKRVAAEIGRAVEESLGILYVEKHFSPEAKRICQEMVDALVAVLAGRFDPETGVTWMSDATKKRALEKLNCFRAKIGYPDVWDVRSAVCLSALR
jgi:putative endopeptidase